MIISMENQEFDACGSSRMGVLENTDFEKLVNSFGEPTFTDMSGDDKVSCEWNLTFELEDGRFVQATIYDWKSEFKYQKNVRWSIGGFDESAVTCVTSVLYLDNDFKKLVEGV